ncbi:MAG: hypothetical protein SFV24_14805 [Gemmatimonadales bacterium]|nr:hypothetical protein [Gemmatimonadales bacterium]
MTSLVRWIVGGLVVAAGGVATAWLSAAPIRPALGGRAVVRLVWSGRPERIDECRRLTDAELEAVPAHMRLRVKCEGRTVPYALRVVVGDREVLLDTLRGGGTRHDRPIHLFQDIALDAGEHRVRITVERLDSASATALADSLPVEGTTGVGGREGREAEERARARREALPPRLVLDQRLRIEAGAVVLVRYDPDRKALWFDPGG